ncbi:hypothetical protein M8J77_013089 [Diaphorina citri]|nr:hypothetical protein M8J77_013089 [Diaphorina citri]
MALEDYKDIVATACRVTTMAQAFSPVFMLLEVVKEGHTHNVDSTPFVGGLVMGTLALKHGLIMNDPVMLQVNMFTIVLNIIYFAVFYFYTVNKKNLHGQVSKAVLFVSIILGYTYVESSENLEHRFGLIITVFMFALLSAPLFSLKDIIQSQDASNLPFPMIVSGAVVTFLWFLYGFIIKNVFIQFQNIAAFTLCFIQLVLCFLYPGSKDKKAGGKKTK